MANSELDDLEEKGRRKQEKYDAYQKKQQAKKNDPRLRLTRAAFSTSRWLSRLRPGYLFHYFYWIFWGTSAFFGGQYFRYFVTGGPVRFGGPRTGGISELYPPRDGYAMFWPFVVLTAIPLLGMLLYQVYRRRAGRIVQREEAWAAAQPFPIENYPDVLGYSDDEEFDVKVYFNSHHMPEEKRMENIAYGIRYMIKYYRSLPAGIDKMEFKYRDFGKRSGYKFYRNFHQLVEEVFIPLHAEYPIKRILVERDS